MTARVAPATAGRRRSCDDGPMYTGPRDDEPEGRDAELARYERERELRVARRNRLSWKIVTWVMAAAVALLAYDSGGASLDARDAGRPWLYPAAVSLVCVAGLIGLVSRALLRRRSRDSDRRPA